MTNKFHHQLQVLLATSLLGIMVVACNSRSMPTHTPLPEPSTVPAPTPTSEADDVGDVVITLERTLCFGECPAYRLTIAGNGTVIYEGYFYVTIKGGRTATLSREQVTELIDEFERADFFALQDYTEYLVTDMPSAITSITIDGRTKTVRHYFGDNSAPEELIELENKIDEITNSEQWIR